MASIFDLCNDILVDLMINWMDVNDLHKFNDSVCFQDNRSMLTHLYNMHYFVIKTNKNKFVNHINWMNNMNIKTDYLLLVNTNHDLIINEYLNKTTNSIKFVEISDP